LILDATNSTKISNIFKYKKPAGLVSLPCAEEVLEALDVLSPEDAPALEWSDPYNPRLEKFLEKEREEQVRTPQKRDAGKQL